MGLLENAQKYSSEHKGQSQTEILESANKSNKENPKLSEGVVIKENPYGTNSIERNDTGNITKTKDVIFVKDGVAVVGKVITNIPNQKIDIPFSEEQKIKNLSAGKPLNDMPYQTQVKEVTTPDLIVNTIYAGSSEERRKGISPQTTEQQIYSGTVNNVKNNMIPSNVPNGEKQVTPEQYASYLENQHLLNIEIVPKIQGHSDDTIGFIKYPKSQQEPTKIEIKQSVVSDKNYLQNVLSHELVHYNDFVSGNLQKETLKQQELKASSESINFPFFVPKDSNTGTLSFDKNLGIIQIGGQTNLSSSEVYPYKKTPIKESIETGSYVGLVNPLTNNASETKYTGYVGSKNPFEVRDNEVKQGYLSAVPENKNWINTDISGWLNKQSSKLEYKGQTLNNKNVLEKEGLGFASISTGVVSGFIGVIEHPFQTTKGIGESLLNPIKTIEETGKLFTQNPAQTIGNFAGQSLALGVVGEALPKESKFSFTKESVETPSALKEGEVLKTDLYGIKNEAGQGITFLSKDFEGNIRLKNPDLKKQFESSKEGELTRIDTPLVTNAIEKTFNTFSSEAKVVNINRANELIPTSKELIKLTQNTKSSFITELPKETERLNEKGTSIIYDQAKQYDGKVSGSTSRAAQLSKEFNINNDVYKLIKIPKDIDVHLDKSAEQIYAITQETVGKLRQKDINSRLVQQEGLIKPNAIEVQQSNGEWEKAVEFLNDRELQKENEPPLKDYVVGYKKTGKPININGIKSTALNEELRGTLQGINRVQKTKEGLFDIMPSEKRMKDIGSVSVSARTLEMSKPSSKLKKSITKFESLFPEDLVREQVRKINKESEIIKTEIIDFKKLREEKTSSFVSSFEKSGDRSFLSNLSSKSSSNKSNFSKSSFNSSNSLSDFSNSGSTSSSNSISSSSSSYSFFSKSSSPSSYSKSQSYSSSKSTSPSSSLSISPFIPKLPTITVTHMPSGGSGGNQGMKETNKINKRGFDYTSTIIGRSLGIKQSAKSKKGVFSGLEIRGI